VFGRGKRYLDIGNRGNGSLAWSATAGKPWIRIAPSQGELHAADARVWISIDWSRAPLGDSVENIVVDAGPAGRRTLAVRVNNPKTPRPATVLGHVEAHGYLSAEAEHYWKKTDRGGAAWRKTRLSFADGGHAMCSYPMTKTTEAAEAPELVYRLYFQNAGQYFLNFVMFDRTLFKNFYFSLDDGPPVLVDSNYPKRDRDQHDRNIPVTISTPGTHYLHVYMRDPGVVIDQIVFTRERADFGNFKIARPVEDSHPGFRAAVAPESYYRLK